MSFRAAVQAGIPVAHRWVTHDETEYQKSRGPPLGRPMRQSCPSRMAVRSFVPATHNEAPAAWVDPETDNVRSRLRLLTAPRNRPYPSSP